MTNIMSEENHSWQKVDLQDSQQPQDVITVLIRWLFELKLYS